MKSLLLFAAALTFLISHSMLRAELGIAENGSTPYQIVIPDAGSDKLVDQWMVRSAKLMQAAFEKNGFEIAAVRESEKDATKPGIYLGATKFAKDHQVKTDGDDWSYQIKAVGKDLVIAGSDKSDPVQDKKRLALLGTVKGVADFLRENMGVRFLYWSIADNEVVLGEGDGLNAPIKIDTRSIGFEPIKRVAVKDGLDVTKTPMTKANTDRDAERFFDIANNFFPKLSFTSESEPVDWGEAIPRKKYEKTHPEYYALLSDGQRFSELPIHAEQMGEDKFCPSHPDVQRLMANHIIEKIEAGNKNVVIMPPDSYRLDYCNCERCLKLFGMRADNWEQVQARGKTGKLWEPYFAIARLVAEKHPEAKIVIWAYQDTPMTTLNKVPENIIPKFQFGQVAEFDQLNGVDSPSGFCALEETFTGFGISGRYLPERTPEYTAEIVKAMHDHRIQWSTRDGGMGGAPGLQGPAYYVYGRMMDDPTQDWKAILEEYYKASFGNVASTMGDFFNQLHEQINLYSDFFGVQMPAWNRKYGRSKYRGNEWHVMSQYPPEYLKWANEQLSIAERNAKDADVKARLSLIRIEFDYIRDLSHIFYLHEAWEVNPTKENLTQVLDALDAWKNRLKALGDGTEEGAMKSLSDWPQMKPFNGHTYGHAALCYATYQQRWHEGVLNWDTDAIRKGILEGEKSIPIPLVDKAPGVDASAWDKAPKQILRIVNDMPRVTIGTTFQVLRDRENLYVRVVSRYPANHPEDVPTAKTEADVFKSEYVTLALRPLKGDTIYQLAINPATKSRFDARIPLGADGKSEVDESWSGKWQFENHTTLQKGRYTLPKRIWTSYFKIPFSDFGVKAPVSGEAWGFNLERVRVKESGNHDLIWSNGKSVTHPETQGTLLF